jgi:hypothetical protein
MHYGTQELTDRAKADAAPRPETDSARMAPTIGSKEQGKFKNRKLSTKQSNILPSSHFVEIEKNKWEKWPRKAILTS